MPTSQIEQLVRVNTLSPIVLTKHVVRSMMADGGGRIVNIASIVDHFTGMRSTTGDKRPSGSRAAAREVGADMALNVKPTIEAMFTIRPPPSAIMERTTCFVRTIGESVFTRTSCSICEVGISARMPSKPTAALLTSP